MTTSEKLHDTGSTGSAEIEMSEGLAVIDRQEKGLALPSITGFGVVERCEENGTPLKTELDSRSGSMNLVIDKRAFVRQVFNGLTVAGGEHKGKLLSQQLIDAEIKRGKELLLKEDLFEGETGEEYRQYQLNVSKMFTVADNKRKELKDPVTKINKAFQGLLEATLGDLIEIRAKVMVRTKEHRVEVEKRDREAKQADAALREATDNELRRIAYLAVDTMKSTAAEIKEVAAELLASEFAPHESQAVAYVEAVAKASEALANMYNDKVETEAAAALQKEEADKKAAADKEELDKLRAGKADQELKDKAAVHLAHVNELFGKCIGSTSKLIAGFIASMNLELEEAAANKHFDSSAASGVKAKMHNLLTEANQKEESAAAKVRAEEEAKKVAADKIKQDAADKKAKEDREKAEAAAALEKANQELLLGAGFTFDGKAYTKGGFLINADKAKRSPASDIGSFIISTDQKIAANEAAAKKAEDTRIKEAKEAKEKADREAEAKKEADRRSMALKIKEMTEAVEACKDHEAIVKAILEDGIPHVRFG